MELKFEVEKLRIVVPHWLVPVKEEKHEGLLMVYVILKEFRDVME